MTVLPFRSTMAVPGPANFIRSALRPTAEIVPARIATESAVSADGARVMTYPLMRIVSGAPASAIAVGAIHKPAQVSSARHNRRPVAQCSLLSISVPASLKMKILSAPPAEAFPPCKGPAHYRKDKGIAPNKGLSTPVLKDAIGRPMPIAFAGTKTSAGGLNGHIERMFRLSAHI